MPVLDTTTNNAFQYPTAGNDGIDFASGIADLATDVDGMWLSGTVSALPAAGTRNRVFWGTDTKLLYQDNGTTWQTVMLAGAWQNMTLGSGIAYTSPVVPASRIEGDVLRLKGSLANVSGSAIGSTTTLATLSPPGLQVPCAYTCVFQSSWATGVIYVGAGAGAYGIELVEGSFPSGGAIALSGLTFPLAAS